MQPLRIRISRIVDFGTVVSLVGIDTGTAMAVAIHVDHRPFASFWKAWRKAGLPPPIEYAADRLILRLDMSPAEDAGAAELIELHDAVSASTTSGQQSAEEIGR
jgi:hypothetical protein